MWPAYVLTVSRLDIQHYAIQHATGKRFFAPITEPQRAVDIGTGSGTWMLASIYITYVRSTAYTYVGNGY
jgi:ubiquinone/menaquinone biosynthesis C-methylase UbiE